MKIVVTGGAGFLGQLLIRALVERGQLTRCDGEVDPIEQIVAVDSAHTGKLFVDDRVGYVRGDIADDHFLSHVMSVDTDSIFHLAAVPSGAAEADFELGTHVNLDGMRWLLHAARAQKARPKVVFASTLAVFGGELPAVVTDSTARTPRTSYGTQKLIGELLIGEYTRKGYIDGRAVRLPTIVVRPGAPNGAASSFASSIFREPLSGKRAICPVGMDTSMWISSPDVAIANLIHAHEIASPEFLGDPTLNLPGLTVSVEQMLATLRAIGGDAAVDLVDMQADQSVEAIVNSWPARFVTERADRLGFKRDVDFATVVRDFEARRLRAEAERQTQSERSAT